MRLATLKSILFAGFLAAPAAALCLGVVEPYGQEPLPSYPEAHSVLAGEPGAFDALGEALLHRSALTREAIRLRNTVAADIFGFVDTSRILSGRDGWLFYKEDFAACADRATVAAAQRNARIAAARLDVMTDLADVAGLAMTVSLAPDKSTIYPELLPTLGYRTWWCAPEMAAALRRAFVEEAPRIVDPTPLLLAQKMADPAQPVYFPTDTHWTPLAAAVALRQLLQAVYPGAATRALPPPRPAGMPGTRETDMGHAMLLLPDPDRIDPLDPAIENALGRFDASDGPGSTVILGDSFYGWLVPTFGAILDAPRIFAIDSQTDGFEAAAAGARRLIVNSVERLFLFRVLGGRLSWNGLLGTAILARNANAASACAGFSAAAVSETVGIASVAGGWRADGPDPQLVLPIAGGQPGLPPCLRFTIEAPEPVDVEIFVPDRHEPGGFEAGRSIRIRLGGGAQTITLVLPAHVRGKAVRLDPGDGPAAASIVTRSIEIGTLAPVAASRP